MFTPLRHMFLRISVSLPWIVIMVLFVVLSVRKIWIGPPCRDVVTVNFLIFSSSLILRLARTVVSGPMGMVVFMVHVTLSSKVLLSSPLVPRVTTLGNFPAAGLSLYSGRVTSIPFSKTIPLWMLTFPMHFVWRSASKVFWTEDLKLFWNSCSASRVGSLSSRCSGLRSGS